MPRPYTRHPCGIYGPRNLVRRQARRVKNRLLAEAGASSPPEPPVLPPGQEQLFSFWTPSLEAGEYTVNVTQSLSSPSTNEQLTVPEAGTPAVTQVFDVVAPRYTLPDTAIHSSFPPQGYGALSNTLPHVVLTDPHLPWARTASTSPASTDSDYGRNAVPWLAVLVFTQDELKLSANQLSMLFANTSLGSGAQQTQTLTVHIPVADVQNIESTVSPITHLVAEPSDDASTDVILVPSALFSELVASYDQNGSPVSQTTADVSRYKYMAHARDINTTGMPDAGVEDNGVFGIVVSHRTGPLANTESQPVVAHLVSIEGVEKMAWPLSASNPDAAYVAMTSLYSWNFVTLPQGSFDIVATFQHLGTAPVGLNLLRAPDTVIAAVNTSTPFGPRLQSRLNDGFTLTRYRTMTGEETAAIYRGPLSPTVVPYPLVPGLAQQTGLKSCWLSNSGIDLQIMDPEVGLMDITYSVAWQLGKTLAVADDLFTTALGRLRTAISSGAMNGAKEEVLRRFGAFQTRSEAVNNLKTTLPKLNSLHKSTPGLHGTGGSMADRWIRPAQARPDLSYHSPLIKEIFGKHASAVAGKLMLSSDGDGSQLYDELNTASSVDWMIVLKWVLNKMFLYSIPAHYLIIDPSYLPPESLRFFHIDRNWTDALIDGALSIGNHMGDPDNVRFAIHQMIENYLDPPPSTPSTPTAPPPPMPTYGFMMHSDAVTKYPDLKVTVELSGDFTAAQAAASILRLENLDASKGVMLCFLDRLPGNPGIRSITFTEPPHQQSFIAGATLDSKSIQTIYKQIFTAANQPANPQPWDDYTWSNPTTSSSATGTSQAPRNDAQAAETSKPAAVDFVQHPPAVFKWGVSPDPEVRTLLPTSWAADVSTVLNFYGAAGGKYVDTVPNAAMAGIQLNNPIYRLQIAIPTAATVTQEQQSVIGRESKVPAETKAPFPPVVTAAASQVKPSELQVQTSASQSGPTAPTAASSTLPTRPGPAPRIGAGFKLGPSHGYPAQNAPHYRRVPELNLNPPKAVPAVPGAAPPTPPMYQFTVLPVDNDPSNPGIPSGTGIPKDLVFSVIQQSFVSPNFSLQEMQIFLQLAVKPGDKGSCLLDTPSYTGPGPFMTSNLRFVVLVQTQVPAPNDIDQNTYLVLRIIPRSTTGQASPGMSKEMTFILPVCLIAAFSHPSTQLIPIWTRALYNNTTPPKTPQYAAIKLAAHS